MSRSRRVPRPDVDIAIAEAPIVAIDHVDPNAAQLLHTFISALRLCGINSPALLHAITVTQTLQTIHEFGELTADLINKMSIMINKTPRMADEVPLVIPVLVLQRLLALQQWIHWQKCRGLVVDASDFNPAALQWSLSRMKEELDFKIESLPSPTTPEKLKNIGHTAWIPFWKQFDHYCSSIRGSLNIPLSYVYREHVNVTPDMFAGTYDDTDSELIATVQLSGKFYLRDNKTIWDLLVPLVTTGHAWPFIRRFEKTHDGRAAIGVLKAASEGDSSVATRRQKAYDILRNTTYTAKSGKFSFDNYCEWLQFAFSELEDCDEPVPESKKVDTFMSNIQTDTLQVALNYILGHPAMLQDFTQAKDYCMSVLSRMKSSSASANHRGVSSVAIGNLKTSYTPEEWKVLPQQTRNKVIQRRKDERKSSYSSSTMTGPKSKAGMKRKIKALQKELKQHKPTPPTISDDKDTTTSTICVVKQASSRCQFYINATSKSVSNRTELDSHADTCVGGSNSILLESNGEVATVHSFSNERKPFVSIPIGTIATTWTHPITGESFLLLFPESLYFGDRLPTTLLCPNQLRNHGVKVDDTPTQYDSGSSHSISTNGIEIGLTLDGVISYFESFQPTAEDVATLTRIVLTSEIKWNPTSPHFAEQEKASQHREVATLSTLSNLGYKPLLPELCCCQTLYHRLVSCVTTTWKLSSIDNTIGSATVPVDKVVFGISTKNSRSIITKEILSRRWHTTVSVADATLRATSQRGIRISVNPTDRRLPTSHPQLAYNVIKRRMYSDTMFSKVKSLHLHTSAQVWTDGSGYALFYPLKSKQQAWTTVAMMVSDMNAIPSIVITDGALEEYGHSWKKEMQHFRISQRITEPHSQWQNKAEGEIREIKRIIRSTMMRTQTPPRLWDYCGEWACGVRRRTALEISDLKGMTPEENIHGRVVDISAYAQFDWYSLVWFIDPPSDIATSRRQIGRWIGVAEKVGSSLCYYILPKSCRPIARSSVMSLTQDDALQPQTIALIADYDAAIQGKIGINRSDEDVLSEFADLPISPIDVFNDDEIDTEGGTSFNSHVLDADDWTPESFDQYIAAHVVLPRGDQYEKAVVKRRKIDPSGNPVGIRNTNPILDTREYEVEFPDGSIDSYTANAIAEAMYSQVDDEGHHHLIIKDIIDHRKDGSAVHIDDGMVPGTQQKRWTTKGWFLLIEWMDSSTSWVPLKDIKESNPIHVAEYAVANKLVSEPAFAWWVAKVLKLRDRSILKVKKRFIVRTHKFGIEIPRSTKRALEIDRESGTDLWRKAIEKEMKNNSSAFEILDTEEVVPVGYTKITCHLIFDIKMDFTRKARFVAGGHLTAPPKESVYSSVVSRESVRIFFLLCALNNLDCLSCDVQNAYLNAGTKEKNWFVAGAEMGSQNVGKSVLIVKALYGLRSSGAQWREHMATTLRNAGFSSCKADPDVWLRSAVKLDGTKYYEYVLCYVDDLLCGSENPKYFMDYLGTQYKLKDGSVKEPDIYLGADIKKFSVGIEECAWGISSDTYIRTAVKEVERKLNEVGQKLATRCPTPMSSGYRPELDTTHELSADQANYFQSLIGILRWAIELGRVDIIVETNMLSRFLVSPRLGHLEQVLHIFAYLKRHSSCSMVFNHLEPTIDESSFRTCDWSSQYPNARESIPPNMPEPRGQQVITRCFVDADHAGCIATRRSNTGVIIYINKAPILWFSKRQNTVESSTFGSEFVALRQAIDLVEGLRYKLRMMGVPIDDSTAIYCDNEAVVRSTTAPESTLKKKHNAICYHRAREAQASGHVRLAKILGTENRADPFTKVTVGEHRTYLMKKIFFHAPGDGNFSNLAAKANPDSLSHLH